MNRQDKDVMRRLLLESKQKPSSDFTLNVMNRLAQEQQSKLIMQEENFSIRHLILFYALFVIVGIISLIYFYIHPHFYTFIYSKSFMMQFFSVVAILESVVLLNVLDHFLKR